MNAEYVLQEPTERTGTVRAEHWDDASQLLRQQHI